MLIGSLIGVQIGALVTKAVLFLIFMPIFGDGKNGLMFSDDMFNKLSKGSSYFIPDVKKSNEKFMGKEFVLTIKMIRHLLQGIVYKKKMYGNLVEYLKADG